jgi:transcriptional regulator with XRE-family HTH domain
MTLTELIDIAVAKKGTRRHVAEGLHQSPQRLTDWKAGSRKPDAHEIAYLAECADLPVLETVAEIEAQLDERYAGIWRAALGRLRAAGVTAAAAGMAAGMAGAPNDSHAKQDTYHSSQNGALYIMSTIRKVIARMGASRKRSSSPKLMQC